MTMHKHALKILVAGSALVCSGASGAIDAQVASQDIGLVKFTEPFSDPDGSTTAALARAQGLGHVEAERRLRLMNEASKIASALQARFSDAFTGIEITSKPTFGIALYGSAGASDAMFAEARSIIGSGPLAGTLRFKSAPSSAKQTLARARGLLVALDRKGVTSTIASNAVTGQFKLLVGSPAAALSALLEKSVEVPSGTKIEQYDGIVLTATEVPGGFGYNGSAGQGCTRGFNVRQVASPMLYGTSTAGHCDNGGTDARTGVSQAFKQEWVSNNLDSQWHTFSGGTSYLVVPKFNTGSSIVSVTGAQYPTVGSYICKYGLTTGQTCGYIDQFTYSDSYGAFPRMNADSSYPTQSLEGDSGGPVYAGSLAIGQVHGRSGSAPYHMFFTPLSAWGAANLPINVTCYC